MSVPHVVLFEKSSKKYHGMHHSYNQPKLFEKISVTGKSILLIDDVFNTGNTLKLHFDHLVNNKNHVDCLVFLKTDYHDAKD